MINDFMSLGDCRLNEDRANCRAKYFGMAVKKKKTPASFAAKKRTQLSLWTLAWLFWPSRVHLATINHWLLTAETARSHQHAIVWVTYSILTTLAPSSNEAPFLTLPPSCTLQEMKTRWLLRQIVVYNEVGLTRVCMRHEKGWDYRVEGCGR